MKTFKEIMSEAVNAKSVLLKVGAPQGEKEQKQLMYDPKQITRALNKVKEIVK